MSEAIDSCSDCQGHLEPIRLIDATNVALGSGGTHHTTLSYAAADAKRSMFLGAYPRKGRVMAFLCVECGRIFLYGVPK